MVQTYGNEFFVKAFLNVSLVLFNVAPDLFDIKGGLIDLDTRKRYL